MIVILEFSIPDIHQKIMLFVTVCPHLPGLQQFSASKIQTDQVHRVFVQMPVVFFPVPVVQLFILPDNRNISESIPWACLSGYPFTSISVKTEFPLIAKPRLWTGILHKIPIIMYYYFTCYPLQKQYLACTKIKDG